MRRYLLSFLAAAIFLIASAAPQIAHAATQVVAFNVLNASATLPTAFAAADNLRLNTLVSTEVGALLQTINFTVAPGVTDLIGEAVWETNTATGTGPRLTGVNIDIFDAANALVTSDTFLSGVGGFAISNLASAISPGSYHLVATGTGVRESSLDVTLSFSSPVPAPAAGGLLLTAVAAVSFRARRRIRGAQQA